MLVLNSPSEHCGILQSWWRILGSVVKHQGPVVVLSGLRHKFSRRSRCLCLWGKKLMEWGQKQRWCLWNHTHKQNCSKFFKELQLLFDTWLDIFSCIEWRLMIVLNQSHSDVNNPLQLLAALSYWIKKHHYKWAKNFIGCHMTHFWLPAKYNRISQ